MHGLEAVREYYMDSPVHISQYKNEFTDALKLFKIANPATILEIGTHYGGTLYQWLKHSDPYSTIAAIDDHHINEHMYTEWREPSHKLFAFKGKSQDPTIIRHASFVGPYDFIFIDADHSYESVAADWKNYSALANPYRNSIIMFHDIMPHPNTEVDIFWKEIKLHYEHWEFYESPDQDGCGIGALIIPRSA